MIDDRRGARPVAGVGRRRRFGLGLLAFGIAGLVLTLAAAALALGSLAAVDQAATGFEQQRAELASMLEPASAAPTHAADSASHAGSSLAEASNASLHAADLTDRLAASFQGMAGLSAFDVLGARPFAGVSSQFADVAAQSSALSIDLRSMAGTMSINVADSESVSSDLRTLAGRLDELHATLAPTDGATASATLPIGLARLVLLGLLAWFAVPAMVSTWLGWRLLHPAARRLRAPLGGVI